MWQWCHGRTGSDQGHMLDGAPSQSSMRCILYIRNWTFRLMAPGGTGDASHVEAQRAARSELSAGSLQNSVLTQNSKLPSGSVILWSCCDTSQVNYHHGSECIRNLTVKHIFGGRRGAQTGVTSVAYWVERGDVVVLQDDGWSRRQKVAF